MGVTEYAHFIIFGNGARAELSGRGRWHNRPPATAQSDATESVSFAESTEDDFVSIFQKFPLLSRRQTNWILAARG